MTDEGFVRYLGSRFFAPGYDREDIEQEARLAMFLCPEYPRLAARRRVIDIVKRPRIRWEQIREVASPGDVVDRIDARVTLERVLRAPRTRNEEVAVGRVLRGEPIRRHEKTLQGTLYRFRKRVA
jgi:hypothetical protein